MVSDFWFCTSEVEENHPKNLHAALVWHRANWNVVAVGRIAMLGLGRTVSSRSYRAPEPTDESALLNSTELRYLPGAAKPVIVSNTLVGEPLRNAVSCARRIFPWSITVPLDEMRSPGSKTSLGMSVSETTQ